jgi:hypothetical protein
MRPTVLSFTATGAVSSQWVPVDIYVPNSLFALQLTSTGQTCSVQCTVGDPYTTGTLASFAPTATALTSATGTQVNATHSTPVRAFRLSAAGAGTFGLTIVQQGTQ